MELALEKLHGVGHLMVKVKPKGSRVAVDRTPRGQTPVEVINLSAGTHRLTVSRDGYHSRSRLIKILPRRQITISGKLKRRQGPAADGGGGLTVQTGEDSGPLSPQDMPEEQTFQPVRKLVSEGKLEEALDKLDELAGGDRGSRYATRIARDRVVIGFMKKVREAAWLELQTLAGEQVTIPTEIGARFSGELRNVSSDGAKVKLPGNGRTVNIDRSDIRTEKIIELASERLDAESPRGKARIAAYYAGQGMLDKASTLLSAATKGGYDAPEVKSYIKTERMWKRAQQQARKSRGRRRGRQKRNQGSGPALILVHASEDAFKGHPVAKRLKEQKATLLREKEPFAGRDLWEADAVILGAGDQPAVYTRREMQRALEFVHSGGGLVILDARPPDDRKALRQGMPLVSLLQAFNMARPRDPVKVRDKRPGRIPGNKLLCHPASPHPVVRGAGFVLFPNGSAPLVLLGGAEEARRPLRPRQRPHRRRPHPLREQ